jgi:hypothetical protein
MVLYRSPDLVITNQLFVIRRSPATRYAFADLSDVHVVCAEIRRAGRAAPRYTGAWAIVLVVVALMLDSPIVLALAMLTLGGSAAVAALYSRRRRRMWELRARHRGSEVCLFATSNETTFGQVRRATLRALEARGHL